MAVPFRFAQIALSRWLLDTTLRTSDRDGARLAKPNLHACGRTVGAHSYEIKCPSLNWQFFIEKRTRGLLLLCRCWWELGSAVVLRHGHLRLRCVAAAADGTLERDQSDGDGRSATDNAIGWGKPESRNLYTHCP